MCKVDAGGGVWQSFGSYSFNAGSSQGVRLRNDGTNGLVIADAIQLVPVRPTADLADPTDGSTVTQAALNAQGYIDVTFDDRTGDGLDVTSITDVGAEFTLSGSAASAVTLNSMPTLVSGTTYRYGFSGSFEIGAVTVSFVEGTWQDTVGVLNTAEVESFFVSSRYQIEVIFPDSSLTTSQQATFSQAANRWSEIIVGDIPDITVSGYGLVDDLVVEGVEALSLLTKLTRESWALARRPWPDYPREQTPIAFVPNVP